MLGGSCSPCCWCSNTKAFETYQKILQSSVSVTLDTNINYGQTYAVGYDAVFGNNANQQIPDYECIFYRQSSRFGTYALSLSSFGTESAELDGNKYTAAFTYHKPHMSIQIVFNVVTSLEKQYSYETWPALGWPDTGCPVFCTVRIFSYVAVASLPASSFSSALTDNVSQTPVGFSPFFLTTRMPSYIAGSGQIDFGSPGLQFSVPESRELMATGYWESPNLFGSQYESSFAAFDNLNEALILCPPPNVFNYLQNVGGTDSNRVTPFLSSWSPSGVVIGCPSATASYIKTAFVTPQSGYAQSRQLIGQPSYKVTPPAFGESPANWSNSRVIATGYEAMQATTQETATTTAQIAVNYS